MFWLCICIWYNWVVMKEGVGNEKNYVVCVEGRCHDVRLNPLLLLPVTRKVQNGAERVTFSVGGINKTGISTGVAITN